MVPLRGLEFGIKNFPKDLVITYEDAWNNSYFLPALQRMFSKRFLQVLINGSRTGKEMSNFTIVDRFAGDNVSKGTIIDWILFGGSTKNSAKIARNIGRYFYNPIKSSHSLLNSPINEVREIHPEMEIEFELIKEKLNSGKNVTFFPGLEIELDLIRNSSSFSDYLINSNLKFCVDIFHALQRGRRDGSSSKPVIKSDEWINFLKLMNSKVYEIHFRLDKKEVELILNGKANELKTYIPMCYMFFTYKADIIYELYPNLLSSVEESLDTLSEVHSKLLESFSTTLKGIDKNLSVDEIAERFVHLQKSFSKKKTRVLKLKRKSK
jgi:hypothetical protein